MQWIPAILCLIIALAGIYYLCSTRGARRLAGMEQALLNSRRAALRRFGGVLMLLLAAMLYIMLAGIDSQTHPRWFVALLALNLLLLLALCSLALLDVRLTYHLRRQIGERL